MAKSLYLFNSLTETREIFVPSNPHDVKIYCCGPTVDDVPHLGQARTYVFLDVLRRILRHHLGFAIRSVMNVRDLNTKFISTEDTRRYERLFFQTMAKLNVERPDFAPRVTDCVALARQMTQRLVREEFAYYKPGFDITYFSTQAYLKKFKPVFPHTEMRDEGFQRQDASEEGKWHPRDFQLWKSMKSWIDAEGKIRTGIPGRHTECAVAANFYFPDCVDIHLGGNHLRLSHQEKEISLGRAYSDEEDRGSVCLHTGHLRIEGQRMSKSFKNVTTVDEVLREGISPLAIRYMFMKHPYDKPIDFCMEELKKAQQSYDEFMRYLNHMRLTLRELEVKETEEDFKEKWYDDYGSQTDLAELNAVKQLIDSFLMDNLNVPGALEILEDYVLSFSHVVKRDIPYERLRYCFSYVLWMTDKCFGLIENQSESLFPVLKKFKSEVREFALKEGMNETQKQVLLEMCDRVRGEVHKVGYVLEDELVQIEKLLLNNQ